MKKYMWILVFGLTICVGCGEESNEELEFEPSVANASNAVLGSASISLDKGKQIAYRITKEAGKSYQIVLEVQTGDMDLYGHWRTDFRPRSGMLTSKTRSRRERISFTANDNGPYYVIVHATQDSTATLIVESSGEAKSRPESFHHPKTGLDTSVGPFDREWFGDGENHLGWDYPGAVDQSVGVMADGIVVKVGEEGGFGGCDGQRGPYIFVRHKKENGQDYYALYGHLTPTVQENQRLQRGETVGKITTFWGCRKQNASNQNWPHLHLGIWDSENTYPSNALGYGSVRLFVNPEVFIRDHKSLSFPW